MFQAEKVLCRACDRTTVHEVLASVDGKANIEEFADLYFARSQILRCRGCETVSFRGMLFRHGKPPVFQQERFYPERSEERPWLKGAHELPDAVHELWRETREALLGGLDLLATMGVRALIEAACRECGADGRNLADRIDALFSKGLISRTQAEVLHGVRDMGNDAAHEANVDAEKIGLALDAVEHLISGVFVIGKRADALRRKPEPDSGG